MDSKQCVGPKTKFYEATNIKLQKSYLRIKFQSRENYIGRKRDPVNAREKCNKGDRTSLKDDDQEED
ncbi:hypothetical protein ACF0H5_008374 [Mactra antiquata]